MKLYHGGNNSPCSERAWGLFHEQKSRWNAWFLKIKLRAGKLKNCGRRDEAVYISPCDSRKVAHHGTFAFVCCLAVLESTRSRCSWNVGCLPRPRCLGLVFKYFCFLRPSWPEYSSVTYSLYPSALYVAYCYYNFLSTSLSQTHAFVCPSSYRSTWLLFSFDALCWSRCTPLRRPPAPDSCVSVSFRERSSWAWELRSRCSCLFVIGPQQYCVLS